MKDLIPEYSYWVRMGAYLIAAVFAWWGMNRRKPLAIYAILLIVAGFFNNIRLDTITGGFILTMATIVFAIYVISTKGRKEEP